MSLFASLKIAQIKPILTAIGSKTSGTKAQLLEQLEHDVATRPQRVADKTRLLSIDMGIKNLAFCVSDVSVRDGGIAMNVVDWRKIAVMAERDASDADDAEDPFAPPALSKTAYALVKDVFAPYKADTMIIERQRFRSGNASAVQEWTLRVNMLEGMIWAISHALNMENTKRPSMSLWPVNPKQVANFWIDGSDATAEAKGNRSKVEKKQKIDLVRKWLLHGIDERLSMVFSDEAAKTKRAFDAAASGWKTKNNSGLEQRIGKLDDVADCLLQAAAWCKWEDNRRLLNKIVNNNASREISMDDLKIICG